MQDNTHNPNDVFGKTISSYTRAQAIADGVLVDVSAMAREAGFRVPVALTSAVWADCVAWTDADSGRGESGRLWDVLWMGALAAKRAHGAQRIAFELNRVPRDGRITQPRPVVLNLHIGPGDNAEPTITILMPNED
ncbi:MULTISPECIES: DUF6573 family protein [Burkholderia]|uniref:DUF6573 family protein n=1 Tax=Burkholderia TaxID=32008 RepID=UPI000B79E8D3|nr:MULTISPECIES: DUF6573 family protein [Burkholderia]MBY4726893.1 hypothetical protein [Burkholderia contaminans]MCI3971752.1 hypothetical protein [Burkholderia sp. HI4860]MDN7792594.1 hypothetical protein [Burkholderia contaminans]OXJ05936.1 hypothetical protein CFB48_01830 [Burkholderia sp. AU33647]